MKKLEMLGIERKVLPRIDREKPTCEEIGFEHAWETLPQVLMSNPPQHQRMCKNCGKKQIGQDDGIQWRENQ